MYYTEGLQQIELGGFGISEIPLRTLSVQDANSFNPELPELEGVELGDISNIGNSPTIPFVNAQSPLDESGLDDSRIL